MRAPNFVRDAAELGSHLFRGSACPHCGRLDTLVGHGLLHGYDPLSDEHVLRGRRMLCSNRYRRPGCGRTLAVLLASMLRRRIASTASLSTLWRALVEGRAPSALGLLRSRTHETLSCSTPRFAQWRSASCSDVAPRARACAGFVLTAGRNDHRSDLPNLSLRPAIVRPLRPPSTTPNRNPPQIHTTSNLKPPTTSNRPLTTMRRPRQT